MNLREMFLKRLNLTGVYKKVYIAMQEIKFYFFLNFK